MIYGDLNDYKRESQAYPDAIVRSLDWLRAADWSKLDDGRYEIEGDAIFVNVTTTRTAPAIERKAERHFRYTDIQYLISGIEVIGYTRYSEHMQVSDDLSDKDAWLFTDLPNQESCLRLLPGEFAVFMPHDVHRPLCADGESSEIRKAVVKIDTQLLESIS